MPARLPLPDVPVLVAGLGQAAWLSADGEIALLAPPEAAQRALMARPLICHAPATARRIALPRLQAYDLLELYAFVRPAVPVTPTPRGLADALGLPPPAGLAAQAESLLAALGRLLRELAARAGAERDAAGIAWRMKEAGWPWAPYVLAALGLPEGAQATPLRGRSLNIWDRLPEWRDEAPGGPPGHEPVAPEEAEARLRALVGSEAEARPQQIDYARTMTQAFLPREREGEPQVLLAEAGTGVGKTLGYLAPASLWSEKNGAPVWISTFTRNLQQQLDSELDRLAPEPREKARRIVIRKGRENYLCLLNFEELVRALAASGGDSDGRAIAAGLMARWAAATRDGDMVGGDFPGWLPDLLGPRLSLGLADRRGECIFAACPHFSRCFIERSVRRARHADLVVANHALVMMQAALGNEEGQRPLRYIFDEGHHLFGAADSAFAAHLTGREAQELRRWLIGDEARSSTSRLRGLKRRIEDLIEGDEAAMEALTETLRAAARLPGEGWLRRISEGAAFGSFEAFLAVVRQQVHARGAGRGEEGYSLETTLDPPLPALLEAAPPLREELARLRDPLRLLLVRLRARLEDEAEGLSPDQRRRIEAVQRGIARRGELELGAWIAMLDNLIEAGGAEEEGFIDWLGIERSDGREFDVGYYRHYLDPMLPFADALLKEAHGVAITSATLTDGSGDAELDWQGAELRTGARHLPKSAMRTRHPSPFDYAQQTRIFIVNDVARDEMAAVAGAYRALFEAAGGGALGLFTSIARLRGVHRRIAEPLEAAGLPLYAQHVDRWNTATLIDIFRAEEDSCLLGTDAVRDGIDVPGRALRLLVFDRVPWPRPDIRHKRRREAFGRGAYDDLTTRLKLKQAFGRLIRRADDRGVFVLLDRRMPSRLLGAFPDGVEVKRCGLAETVAALRGFLSPPLSERRDPL